jgi:nucleotide-binding universal stress UspA family protein
MVTPNINFRVKLSSVLVATDFSAASEKAVLYATAIARRHRSKLFLVHVVTARSEGALMDGWRAGQQEITKQLLADHLDGIEHELIVRSGNIWEVLSFLVEDKAADLLVIGTRGRTGVRKLILGSVAETIFRQALCPVLTVGPNITGQDPEIGPERILAPTGFAAHSLSAVQYAIGLALDLHSHLGLLNVVTNGKGEGEDGKDITAERVARLRGLIPSDVHTASEPLFFVEFGSAPEAILETAARWKANLIVLGLRHLHQKSGSEPMWAKAYEIISKATCPVLTVRERESS